MLKVFPVLAHTCDLLDMVSYVNWVGSGAVHGSCICMMKGNQHTLSNAGPQISIALLYLSSKILQTIVTYLYTSLQVAHSPVTLQGLLLFLSKSLNYSCSLMTIAGPLLITNPLVTGKSKYRTLIAKVKVLRNSPKLGGLTLSNRSMGQHL